MPTAIHGASDVWRKLLHRPYEAAQVEGMRKSHETPLYCNLHPSYTNTQTCPACCCASLGSTNPNRLPAKDRGGAVKPDMILFISPSGLLKTQRAQSQAKTCKVKVVASLFSTTTTRLTHTHSFTCPDMSLAKTKAFDKMGVFFWCEGASFSFHFKH